MSIRVQQVEELLKKELSKFIVEEFGGEFGIITVTRVIAAPDFKLADVYVSLMEEGKENRILSALRGKVKSYQSILGRKLKMKYTPKLNFKIDYSKDEINKIDELMEEINDES